MIQRIQSLYLLVVATLMGATSVLPLAHFLDNSYQEFGYKAQGFYLGATLSHPTWGVISFAVISTIIALVSLFLYKKRKLQLKLGLLNMLLIVVFYGTLASYFSVMGKEYALSIEGFSYAILFPAIALIFNLLSQASIKKDEKLVRSLDRIR